MANIVDKRIKLKNNLEIEIGSAQKEDAESLLIFGKSVSEDHEFQALYPDEFSVTLEQEYTFIEDHLNSPKKLALLARFKGEVIAMINLSPISRYRKMEHIVTLGIGVLKEYRDCGIGNILFNSALDWVKNETNFEKVEFGVLSTNERAIHLYKKFGFVEEAKQKRWFKFNDNDYRDNVIMSLFLERSKLND